MSDTLDRLSCARSDMDEAHAHLKGALSVFDDGTKPVPSDGAWKLLARMTAEHSRALRELFLASLEAPAVEAPTEQPAQRATYVADGPAYRRLRAQMVARSMHNAVGAIDRLEAFDADEADVRLVAMLLIEALGEHETAASLLRNVEG